MMITLEPIGFVRGGRAEVRDDAWGCVSATIELSERFSPDALAGLEAFSHIEVLFHFHLVPEENVETAARHPRNRKDWPLVGIFAQRGKNRPNRLGSTVCGLAGIEGRKIKVRGLDAVEGTPFSTSSP